MSDAGNDDNVQNESARAPLTQDPPSETPAPVVVEPQQQAAAPPSGPTPSNAVAPAPVAQAADNDDKASHDNADSDRQADPEDSSDPENPTAYQYWEPPTAGPNVEAFQAYQPSYHLEYKHKKIDATDKDKKMLDHFKIHNAQECLAADNPESPYYWDPAAQEVLEPNAQIMVDPGKYEGQLDSNGVRHGVGRADYMDGSSYNGDWACGVRHGNGVNIDAKGIKYEGQWVNDKKHGEGLLTYKDGGMIEGTWTNDRLNGLANYREKKGEKEQVVIYKNDMLVMCNQSGVSGCDIFYVVVSAITLPITAIGVGLGAGVTGLGFMFVFLVWAVVYYIWSACHPATSYIKEARSIDKIFNDVKHAIQEKPKIWFTIQNYHYEWRTRYYTDSNGNRHMRRERVRVNTHYARKDFKVKKWEDHSPPASTLSFLDVLWLTRLTTNKEMHFTSGGKKKVHKKEKKFIKKNRMDSHYDYQYHQRVASLPSKILVYNEKHGSRPWYTVCCNLVMMDIVCLGYILRYLLNDKSKVVKYELIKLVKG